MLQEIRDRATSWVAYIIIGLLVLSFALWGIQEYFGGGAAPPVAAINGVDISPQELNQQVQQRKQMLQSLLGNNYPQQYPDESVIRKEVIDIMVRMEILRQEATEAGYRISDTNLIYRIQQIPQFQQDGKFDSDVYERWLQVRGYHQARFERELREEEKLKQMEIPISASSFMPKADLQRFQKLSDQTRNFKYAVVKVEPDSVTVSAEEIENYYKENQQLFQTPEQIKLAYIELKEKELSEQINITVEDARVIYDSHPERYMTAELRKTRHILLKVDNEISPDATEWDEAMKKANDLVQQLDAGASFAEIAKQSSQDSSSADKGGEIGFIAQGDFTSKELEEALFSLNVGEHSKPIRTNLGIQIVKLDEIQMPEQKPFEDVQEQIINERKSQMARDQFTDIALELENLVSEQPDELPIASGTYDLEIKETNWLASNSNAEIFAHPKIQSQAFSDDILDEGLNSELIEVADGHVIAFRLVEHKTSELKPLKKVTDEIRMVLAVRKSAEEATVKGQKLFTEMQSGKGLEKLSAENSLEVIEKSAIRRDDSQVPFTIMEHAFKLPRPPAGDVSVTGLALPDGTYALVELSQVSDGSEELVETKTAQLSQRLNYGRREFNAVIEALQDASDVEIFETEL